MEIAKQIQRHKSLSKLALDTLNEKLINDAKSLGYGTMKKIEKIDDLQWEHQKDALVKIFNLSNSIRTIEKSVDTALSLLRDKQRDLENTEKKE